MLQQNNSSIQMDRANRRSSLRNWLPWVFFIILTMGGFSALGSLVGYQSAWTEHQRKVAVESASVLIEQYQLAMQNLEQGQYDLARQRFEYLLNKDKAYPGAVNGLQTALAVLYATATPTRVPPTITFTPTPDLRPMNELFNQAQTLFNDGNWSGVIDTIVAIRKNDPSYQSVSLDSLLYQSMRNRGVAKILQESNLEGGLYDLALAEKFGPLDALANNWRNLARLYIIGSSFWEVFPERALEYFGQVAAAAPGLRDASGWTASARYWQSLIHYGNKLALAGEWCSAFEQYEQALQARSDAQLQITETYLAQQCYTPTSPPTLTATIVISATPTLPVSTIDVMTPTPTSIVPVTPTSTLTDTPGIPLTPTPTETLTPTIVSTTPEPLPSDTPVPSDTSVPSDTATSPVSDTE